VALFSKPKKEILAKGQCSLRASMAQALLCRFQEEEKKQALKMARLSWHCLLSNEARLWLRAIAELPTISREWLKPAGADAQRCARFH
jgi:hypothetical protein